MTADPAFAVATAPCLTDKALLDAWEGAAHRLPPERALAVVACAVGADARAALARWPVGRRDAALLDIHAGTFGDTLDAVTACPACGEPLEVACRIGELRAGFAPVEGEAELRAAGHRVAFRAVRAGDLADAATADDAGQARRGLAERCVLGAWDEAGDPVAPTALPDTVVDALDDALAAHDAQADLRLALACPECGCEWRVALDVADFVWRRVQVRAQALLGSVAALAAAYGWAEPDILAMSPTRRALYLRIAEG
jgi:hypothetical protein